MLEAYGAPLTCQWPMSPGSAYVLMHHWIGEVEGHSGAWGWVHGGMGAVSRCLAEAARAAGAEIRAAAPVRRVVVRDGRAAGVELEDGTEVPTRGWSPGPTPRPPTSTWWGRSTSRRRSSGTSAGTEPGRAR
jgi:phytoene dehydrogenase-like protein